jgi:hypothetical protein
VPTYSFEPRFGREFARLDATAARAFLRAKNRFVAALKAGRPFEAGLGIAEMTGHPGIFEFHFSDGGRATFHYGNDGRGPAAHVIWRRIGGHEIYREP